jgi:hypothetical protein
LEYQLDAYHILDEIMDGIDFEICFISDRNNQMNFQGMRCKWRYFCSVQNHSARYTYMNRYVVGMNQVDDISCQDNIYETVQQRGLQ